MNVTPIASAVRSSARHACALAGALLLASGAAAETQLWVVDDGGAPADFTTIQDGVDAASDGDVVLVRAGTYAAFAIDGKGVAVIGEAPGAVVVGEATVAVRNTAPAQSVLLQNLEVRGGPFMFLGAVERALVVEDALGLVSVQDCRLVPNGVGQGGGARIESSNGVALTRCELLGGPDFTDVPVHALVASESSISAYDSTFQGGFGPGGPCTIGCGPAGAAGDGARLDGAWMFASGSLFQGGDGGDGEDACSILSFGGEGADGGDGVRLEGGSTLADLANQLVHGTGGGAESPGWCADGVDGEDIRIVSGTHAVLAGAARSLTATSPIVEGGVTTLVLSGAPGDLAFAIVSLKQGFLPLDPFQGVLLVSATQFFTVFLGAIPPSGTLSVPVQTTPHGVGEVVIQHLQSGWYTALGEIRLGANASVVIEK